MTVRLREFCKLFGYFDGSVFCEHFDFEKAVLRALCSSSS